MVTIDNGESDVIETLINPFFSDIQGSGQHIAQHLHTRLCSQDNYVFTSHLVRLLQTHKRKYGRCDVAKTETFTEFKIIQIVVISYENEWNRIHTMGRVWRTIGV